MRKPITLSIEEKLIKKVKIMAVSQDTTVSDLVEKWIEND